MGAVVLPTGSFDGALPIMLTDAVCEGNKESLLQCPESTNTEGCESGTGAAVVCQGKPFETTVLH